MTEKPTPVELVADTPEFDALHYIRNSPALHDVCQSLRERGERNEAVRQAAREKEAAKAAREAKRAARLAKGKKSPEESG